jgi:hypothetical protein
LIDRAHISISGLSHDYYSAKHERLTALSKIESEYTRQIELLKIQTEYTRQRQAIEDKFQSRITKTVNSFKRILKHVDEIEVVFSDEDAE